MKQTTINRMLEILDTQYSYCPESARDPWKDKRDPQAAYYAGMRMLAAQLVDEESDYKEVLTWKDGKHTIEPSKEYEAQRETARQRAIELQAELAEKVVSYEELAELQAGLEALAKQYDLTAEFQENGLI